MRTVIVFFLSLNLFLTPAFARLETPDQENYSGIFTPDSPVTFHEIRYLYPDHIIQRHIAELSQYLKNHYLGTPGEAPTQKNLEFFESLKSTPFIEEMEMRDPQGNSIDMNIRVRISRYQQHAIIHYELPHSNTIYVEVPPQLLNDVDMSFMDQHLMEEYGQAKPKKVVVFSDHLPSFENFLETYKKLTLDQVDRLMKSLIMSLDYNRQLTHVTEKMIQEMIQKKVFFDSIVESSTQTMDVELAAGLIQMRDKAIDYVESETHKIWNELKKTNPETPYSKAQELLLKKNKNSNFVLPDDSLARIEITTIEDEYVIRILLHGSEKVFLWLSSEMVQKNSKHFQLFLARQHMTAGTDRTDGLMGRDVVLLYFDKPPTSTENQKTLKVEERSKPTTISGKISAKSKSIFKAPQLKDQGFALFCGINQAGIMSAVNLARMAYDPTFQFNAATVAVIFVFGWGIGSVPSTYNNWVYPKVSKMEPPWKT